MDNLEGLLARLLAQHVEFVVIGGYAAVTHGAIDVTRDLDICCPFTELNLLKLQDALAPIHPMHRITMHPSPLELRPGHCARWRNLYLKTDEGVIDCLSEVMGVGGYAEVLQASEVARASFGAYRVLSIPALIDAKQAIGRPHDQRTVIQLRCVLDAQRQKGSSND